MKALKQLLMLFCLLLGLTAQAQKPQPLGLPSHDSADSLFKAAFPLAARYPDSCLVLAHTLHQQAKHTDYIKGIAHAHFLKGVAYTWKSVNDSAHYYLQSAHGLYESLGEQRNSLAVLGNIAQLYIRQGQYQTALDLYEAHNMLARGSQDSTLLSKLHLNMGIAHDQLKQTAEALRHYHTVLPLFRARKSWRQLAKTYYNIASVYCNNSHYPTALAYVDSAYQIFVQMEDPQGIAFTTLRAANISHDMGNYNSAQDYLNVAKAQLAIQDFPQLRATYLKQQTRLDTLRGDHATAFAHQSQYLALTQELMDARRQKEAAKLQAQFATQQMETRIGLLEARQRSENIARIMLVAVLLLVAALGLFFYHQRNVVRTKNNKISQLNHVLVRRASERDKELGLFFYRTSHDLRRPLTTIQGLVNLLRLSPTTSQDSEVLQRMVQTTESMDGMLRKLQAMEVIANKHPPALEIDFEEIINGTLATYQDQIEEHGVDVTYRVAPSIRFLCCPLLLQIMFQQLLENAIHFCLPRLGLPPKITITVWVEGGQLRLSVKDNGMGVPVQYQRQVFDLFFVGNDRSKGNGLGLYLVKRVVERLQGEVTLESDGRSYTELLVALPHSAGAPKALTDQNAYFAQELTA